VGPGCFFTLPCADEYLVVDIRTITFDVPPPEILTSDQVTVRVDAVCYFRVYNPVSAMVNVQNYVQATQLLCQTTLRNFLGTRSLTEILTDKAIIFVVVQTFLDTATDPWGVKVERVEITDVKLPLQLQKSMAAEAEATREAKAKIIAAEAGVTSARALKQAADALSSPSALQLRYLQTLD